MSENLRLPIDVGSMSPSAWHYTDALGLVGILNTQELWASSPNSVNDATEMKFAQAEFRRMWLDVKSDENDYTEFVDSVLNSQRFEEELYSIFFVSASTESDLLNQWMHYANSDGFAIELDTKVRLQPSALPPLIEDLKSSTGLIVPDWYDVEYSEKVLIQKFLEHLHAFNGMHKSEDLKQVTDLVELAAFILMSLFVKTKHPGFRAENEIRFVTSINNPDLVMYRELNGRVRPYLPLRAVIGTKENPTFSTLPIKNIMCSPGMSERSRADVTKVLAKFGYSEVGVLESEIPYIP